MVLMKISCVVWRHSFKFLRLCLMFVALVDKVYWAASGCLTSAFRACTAHPKMSLGAAGNTAPGLEGGGQISNAGCNAWCEAAVLTLQIGCTCSWVAD